MEGMAYFLKVRDGTSVFIVVHYIAATKLDPRSYDT
jgi:hypothetical protein